jgi:hypothetical protein
MEYIIGYIIVSIIITMIFVEINKKQIVENYLNFEKKRNNNPSNGWYNFYVFTHILKAPLLFPLIIALILTNGGKIIK